MATELAKDRAAKNLRKQSTAPSGASTVLLKHTGAGKFTQSISSVSQIEEVPPGALGFKLENTYQLGPVGRRFPVAESQRILRDVLQDYLTEEKYEEEFARSMSQSISQVVRTRIKELQSTGRYKIIVMCSIGMNGSHGLCMASRCLWNDTVDSFTSYQFRNSSLYAVATVFAIYQE